MHELLEFVRRLATACATSLLAAASTAGAADFSVNPIRLEFGPNLRSAIFTVRNDGKERLGFQVDAMEWTQDATGADRYTETRDLIFFPKILAIEAGGEGIIRVGAKNVVLPAEKTYRVFIQEMPSSTQAAAATGPQVTLLMRFGAPVFIAPAKPADSADITVLALTKGVLGLSVVNTGNRHQMIQGVNIKAADERGNEVFALTLADRYLLAGATKAFTASIPSDKCYQAATLTVEFKTDKLSLTRKLDVNRAMCS